MCIRDRVYTVGYVVLSWLAAFLFSAILLYTTSKATLPAKALSTGGVLAGISACAVFFFSIFSTQAEASILLTSTYSLLAVAASITLAIVGIMMLFWLKNHAHELSFKAKSVLALIISLTGIGVHLTYTAALTATSNTANMASTQFNGTLGLICLFLVGFIITLFYDLSLIHI